MWRALALLGASAIFGAAFAAQPSAEASPQRLSGAQSNYVEYCAGCHGIKGSSAPAPVPELRDRVGFFMCTPEGREYLIRLPNVAHAPVSSAEELAELMNFVVFTLGSSSVPSATPRFTASEVAMLRQRPLHPGASLQALRRQLVANLIRTCGAPAVLRQLHSPPGDRAGTAR